MQEQLKIDKIILELTEIIKKNKGKISPKEAAVKTGYSLDEIKLALDRLIELYEVRVNLNQETGELRFVFKYPLFQRNKKTFAEKLRAILSVLYKVFKTVYKASVGVVLVVYTVIFALMILLATSAGQNNDSNNRRDNKDGFNLIFIMLRAILEAMNFVAYKRIVEYAVDPYGNRYKTYKKEKNKGAGFIQSVFTFVFGPEGPKFDPLADAREVLAYLRIFTKGKLTAANIIELTGKDYPTAESRLAEYAGKFGGDLLVSNSGVLYGDFNNMLGEPTKDEAKYIEYYKDEIEPPIEFTGNSSGRNFAIILMNAFNLVMSAMFFSGSMTANVHDLPIAQFTFLGAFPLVVSLLYFIIPILRLPVYIKRKKSRKYRILHKKLVGYICSARKSEFVLYDFLNFFGISNDSDAETIKRILGKIVLELEGSIEISDTGVLVYKFDRLYNELMTTSSNII